MFGTSRSSGLCLTLVAWLALVGSTATIEAAALASSEPNAREDAAPALADEAVRWLAGYLRIDTTNPPGNESEAAAYLAEILHHEGIATRFLVTPQGRTNLYARLAGDGTAGGALILMHHMDVVGANGDWSKDPFGAEIDSKRIWGRGAIDAKSLGIAHLATFIEAKRSGRRLTRDLIFLAVADEETGGSQGAQWLLEEHADLLTHDVAAVLNEGGSNRMVGEELRWWGVEVAQKRPLWLRVSTQGRGGHGSAYNPRSATHRLLAGLANLLIQPPDYRVTPAARDYFEALAPFHNDAFDEVFVAPDLASVQARFARMLDDKSGKLVLLPGMLAFFMDTIQITSVDTSSSTVNVVPEKVSALLDIRLLPDTAVDDMLARLREAVGTGATVEVLLSSPITSASERDNDVYRALERSLSPRALVVPSLITGTTDSRYFRERGIPAYGFSPFILSGAQARGIHGPDESIPLDRFREGLRIMQDVVLEASS